VITLQKYVRRWLAVQELQRLQKFALLQILWEKEQDKLRRQQDCEWEKDIQRRRLNPKNEEDFVLLFSDLQKWWNFEVKAISEARSGADLKAAMWMLVNVEAKRIEEINQMKSATGKEKQLESRNKFLTEASRPKLWKAYKDQIKVVTANTERGSNLHDLYMTLSLKCVSAKDRIDVLTRLKDSIQLYKCALTDNLTKLADREIDLLLRGIKSIHLEGLRSRIRSLFWQYAKQPSFNPEMQRLSK
ncbi:IQ and ubiquitin-like domain-containing protein, partial [Stegodyphus dumicola]|uniref:IQ and ubiquitin-like domain-containing protein n=1 Tax=Stegodyphus dumicola TaxID=202533 RepID=UPI0015AEE55B